MLPDKELISILVVSCSDKVSDAFNSIFEGRYTVDINRASSISEAKRMVLLQGFDMVVVNSPLKDETGIEFSVDLSSDGSTGVLLLINNEYYDQVSYEVGRYGVLTLSKPMSRQTLYEAANLVVATNFRLKKVELKNAKLTAKMEEIRIVNHAKWVLIENLHLSEVEAHKIIEKQAMDTRQSKREVAETILKTYRT